MIRIKKQRNPIDSISWVITEPVENACLGYDNDQRIPISDEIWNIELGIKKGDRVVIVWRRYNPCIIVPVSGSTLRDMFVSICNGMDTYLSVNDKEHVDKAIADFYHENDRKILTDKYKNGDLKPRDLCGDYVFFEGNFKRDENGLWTFGLGS